MSTKRFVCTGYRGFIGSHLTKALTQEGHEVVGIDMKDRNNACDISMLLKDQGKFDTVFHLAAHISKPWKQETVDACYAIEEYCHNTNTHLVFSSSAAVHDQTSHYGAQKILGEAIFKERLKSASILRFFNVYGPGGSGVVDRFIKVVLERMGAPLVIDGSGIQTRDFVHVDDVVQAMITASEIEFHGTAEIGTGKSITINSLLAELEYPNMQRSEHDIGIIHSQAELNPLFPWHHQEILWNYLTDNLCRR